MDFRTFLIQSPVLGREDVAKRFAREWAPVLIKKGACLAHQGDAETLEHVVLDGRVISQIVDPVGVGVCVGLYSGPCVITPNVARTSNGISRVSLEAMTDVLVMQIPSEKLTTLMLGSEPIRDWANGVLRAELSLKSDREWCLAALGGADRLKWFRENYLGYEAEFNHAAIASFLGITPVTLSRLRKASKGAGVEQENAHHPRSD